MINRLLLATAKRLRPELSAMSGLDLIGSLLDLVALIYMLPFAVIGIAWLVTVGHAQDILTNWPLLLATLVTGWLFRRLDFTLRLELRPGLFALATGSFESLVFWSSALLVGPTALWATALVGIFDYLWERRSGRYLRWNRWRRLANDLATTILPGLVSLQAYSWLGGRIPFSEFTPETLVPVITATAIWFALSRLMTLPLLLYASRSPELVGTGSLTDQSALTRFFLVGTSVSGIADPFAVLAASLYSAQGMVVYLLFLAATLLAALLANRLSDAVARSEQRSREMEILERLARSIMTAPPESSALNELVSEHIEGLFPNSRIEIRLFPENVIFRQHPRGYSVSENVWEELKESLEYKYMPAAPPSDRGGIKWDGLAVPILRDSGDAPVGGIHLLTQRGANRAIDLIPAAQSLAAQIGGALDRIDHFNQALEEQASAYQREVYAQAYQAEIFAQALTLEKMTKELTAAGQIQASFLPEDLPDVPGWQMAVTLEPAREASGDFYDVIELPGGRLGLVVADVAEKGMGAALYMALSRTLIRTYALQYPEEPARVLQSANERILADTNSDLFVTVFYAVLNPETGELTYCNAGHNPPLHLRSQKGDALERLGRTALPLGLFEDVEWDESVAQMLPGDVLLVFTDGITEAQDEDDTFFGDQRLESLLKANAARSASMIEDKVLEAILEFTGDAPQFDDITLMILVRESS